MSSSIQLPRDVYGSEEHQMLRETVLEFFKTEVEPNREEWEKNTACSREVWLKAGELGLLGLTLDPKYGGSGLDFSFSALAIETFAKTGADSPGISMHSDIVIPYIEKHGSDVVKDKYLPKMCSGESIGSL